jgi:hypothetical protein
MGEDSQKKVASLLAAAVPNGTCAASSRTAFVPPKAAPKAAAPPKAVAPKTSVVKVGSHATPSTVSGVVVTKAIATG